MRALASDISLDKLHIIVKLTRCNRDRGLKVVLLDDKISGLGYFYLRKSRLVSRIGGMGDS